MGGGGSNPLIQLFLPAGGSRGAGSPRKRPPATSAAVRNPNPFGKSGVCVRVLIGCGSGN